MGSIISTNVAASEAAAGKSTTGLQTAMAARKERYMKVYAHRIARVKGNTDRIKVEDDLRLVDKLTVRQCEFGGDAKWIHNLYKRICALYGVIPHALYDGNKDPQSVDDEEVEAPLRRSLRLRKQQHTSNQKKELLLV